MKRPLKIWYFYVVDPNFNFHFFFIKTKKKFKTKNMFGNRFYFYFQKSVKSSFQKAYLL